MAYLYARSLEVKKNPTDAGLYLRDSLLGRIGGVWNMANGTALFNAIYAQNWLEVVNLVAGVNDPDRGNNQGGLYGRRELGAMMEEFIYMRGWIASVPETLLTQRRTVERTLVQTEAHLYGSSRLGVDKVNRRLLTQKVDEIYMPFNKRWVFLGLHTEEGVQNPPPNPSYVAETPDSLYLCVRGLKRYEFSNHLGNVMTTLTDRRVWENSSSRWTADAISGQDYDPFGMVRPNRSASDDGYRFGFNGKEKDTDLGTDNYDFGARIYDGRVARWLSVDPLQSKLPELTPYCAFANNPLVYIDNDGKIPILVLYALKVGGETAIDIILDETIFYLTAEKVSGTERFLTHGTSLLINMTVVLGEGYVAWKFAKLSKTVWQLADKLNDIKGIRKLARGIGDNLQEMTDAFAKLDVSKMTGAYNNFVGKIYNLKLAQMIPGVTEVGQKVLVDGQGKRVAKGGPGVIQTDIDLIVKRGQETIYGEAKSGDFSKKTFDQFLSSEGKQLKTLENLAKNDGAKVAYYFKEGNVSESIVEGLQKKGIEVVKTK